MISYEEYHPFGTSAYRAASASEVSERRYRYIAKERDEETGFYSMGVRYYAPWLARWTSADPAGIGADGPGLFTYCRGNPVGLRDPNGREGVLAGLIANNPVARAVANTATPWGQESPPLMLTGEDPSTFAEDEPAYFSSDPNWLEVNPRAGRPAPEPETMTSTPDTGEGGAGLNLRTTGGGGADSGEQTYQQLTPEELQYYEGVVGSMGEGAVRGAEIGVLGALPKPLALGAAFGWTVTHVESHDDPDAPLAIVSLVVTIPGGAPAIGGQSARELAMVEQEATVASAVDEPVLGGTPTTAVEGGGGTPSNDVVYHYTTRSKEEVIQRVGLFSQSSATDVGTYTAQEAVELLGVKTAPEVVIEIQNGGRFIPNRPPIVQPHPLGPGGGLDLTNPAKVPPTCIVCVRRVKP